MKFNRIIFVSILLLIFEIGAVNAADENITDTTEEVLSVEPVYELEAAQGDFAELSSLVENTSSGKTLKLEKDYVNDKSSSEIRISKEITIDGQGHTIDANKKSSIFVATDYKVTLKNINFINSYGNYGTVYGNKDSTIINCTFTDCRSSGEENRGAITGASAYNCSFKNCNSWYGSAMCDSNAYNCSFVDCSADCGGAIFQSNAYDCSFKNCYSPVDAGGAIFYGNAYNCSFESCHACGGGAICFGNAYDSSFVDCYSEDYNGHGGAIWDGDAYNCSFINCYCSEGYNGRGGAIWDGDAHNCSFKSCHAYAGGAVSKGNSFDSSFLNCYAVEDNGGAISNGNATNCYFENCYAADESCGGAIGYGNAYNSSFVNCKAAGDYGGAIFHGNANDSSFINCHCEFYGGAIFIGDAYGCTFLNCYCAEGGAIFGSKIITNCLFINCSSVEFFGEGGGAICESNNANNCLFINCSSNRHAAVMYGGRILDSYCVNCHDAYNDELTYPTAWSEENYNEGNYAFKSDSPFIYGYAASYSLDSSQVVTVVVLASDATGNVKFTINGVTKKVKVANGMAKTYFNDLYKGTYPVTIQYEGDGNYTSDTITTSIKIDKKNAIKSVSSKDIEYGEDAVITLNVDENAPGNIEVTLNDVTQKVKITSATLNVKFSGLKIGSYDAMVSYSENDKFNGQNMTTSFNVVKGTPIASGAVDPNPVGFGDDAVISVNMSNNKINGNVWFTISDENKTKILTDKIHIENGTATRAIPGLGLGNYYLHLYYAGTTRYNAQTIKGTFEVVKKTPIASVNVSNWAPGEDVTIRVKVNNVNGNIWYTISDSNKTKILTDSCHIEDGWAIISVPALSVGKYYLHIYYAGNVHYAAQTIKSSFEVTKISPELSVAKTTVDGKTVLTASIAEDARGNVKFEVNGSTYKAQIVKGVATITLPDMAPGTYILKSRYGGNYKYLAETKTRSITIK
ncbi:hypothetical protein TL18_03350 [Methanobrevibacter sp. YE315]|uniref:Ig-like domain repeat protein n=1 Tax=Methanobrevibacter sp. YE315 TaxID=1609968 RepID=UPI000764EB03|nr:Ig-like domain repeat protein [Methanobrevibacter sp. YE315]AMD17139.1 hypothetical protein TL18_03350 [Methanobrevibacter sp. YE315]